MRLVCQLVSCAALMTAAMLSWAGNLCTGASAVTLAERLLVDSRRTPLQTIKTVSVPDSLALELRDERVFISYTIDVSACADSAAASIWLFRVGAPYTVSHQGKPLTLLSANQIHDTGMPDIGQQITTGTGTLQAHNGRIPALFSIPPGVTRVTVTLLTLPYISTGMVGAVIGPINALLPLQANGFHASVGYANVASSVLLILSLITALLWLRRRNDRGLMWLALACMLWSIRGLAYFGHSVYFSPVIFELFNSLSVLLTSAAFSMSVVHLLGNLRRSETSAFLAVAGAGALGVMLAVAMGRGATSARAFCLLAAFCCVGWLFWRIWQSRKTLSLSTMVTLTAGLLVLVSCAVHDIMVVVGFLGPQSPSHVFWGFVGLLIGLTAMSGQYVAITLNRAEHTNEELELRVAKASSDLQQTFAKLSISQQKEARTQERTRLMRDMHDGLGAQLMTALRGVERGALSPPQIALSLQDSLDELRLLIDSADMGQHLHQALAGWRSRWETRLAAAGIMIEWHIDDALDDVVLPNETVLQAVRILQEAAANVVKHSRATRLVLRTRLLAPIADGLSGQIQITVTDNGTGLPDVAASSGSRGLQNMKFRAANIGAQLEVTSVALPSKGCHVLLTISLADELPPAIKPG